MTKNVGTPDRIMRIVLAALLAYLYFSDTVSGTIGLVLVVLAVIFLGTALLRFCPIYALLGLSTCPTDKA